MKGYKLLVALTLGTQNERVQAAGGTNTGTQNERVQAAGGINTRAQNER